MAIIGAKKNLSIRDIMHSAAVAGMGQGINQLVGGFPAGEGLPGGDGASFQRESVRDVKEKEEKLMEIFGTKVKINKVGRGGKIVIEYYGEEDLSHLMKRLLS